MSAASILATWERHVRLQRRIRRIERASLMAALSSIAASVPATDASAREQVAA